jgi:hypothetical protein
VELENLEINNEKYCLSLTEGEARNFLKVYFNDDVEQMIDNLVIDREEQTCYLKHKVEKEKLP